MSSCSHPLSTLLLKTTHLYSLESKPNPSHFKPFVTNCQKSFLYRYLLVFTKSVDTWLHHLTFFSSALPNPFWKVWDDSVFLSWQLPWNIKWWFSLHFDSTNIKFSPSCPAYCCTSVLLSPREELSVHCRSSGELQTRALENSFWRRNLLTDSGFQFKGDPSLHALSGICCLYRLPDLPSSSCFE